jgi:hypothetical protein
MYTGGTMTRLIHPTFNIPTQSEAYVYAASHAPQNLGHWTAERL